MNFDSEPIYEAVLHEAEIEVLWEKPSTGESGFLFRQPYSSGGAKPLIGDERLQRIPEGFRAEVAAALCEVGRLVEFPYKQDDWADYQWFEQRLIEEQADTDGELIRIYYSRRIQQSKQLELMLKQALDTNRMNIIEENLDSGEAIYLYKYSKNPDELPQLAGKPRQQVLGAEAADISRQLELEGSSVQFSAMLPGRPELDWVKQTNFRNFVNESGQKMRWIWSKNITEFKHAEIAVNNAYEQLSRSARMGDLGSFTYDLSTDRFALDSISRNLLALPESQYPDVDSDTFLSYVVTFNAKQLRQNFAYQSEVQGSQTLELNVRGWDGIHRWVKLKFEFMDAAEGRQACGVLIDITDLIRQQAMISQQLRKLEEQKRVVEVVMETSKMVLIEIDLDTGMGEILRGSSPHERLYSSFDVNTVQKMIYNAEDFEKQRALRDSPGHSSLIKTYDVSGKEFLFWALVGYTPTYRREGRVYQLFYRRIVDNIERLYEEYNKSADDPR